MRSRLAPLVLVAGLVLAACGGGSSTSSGSADAGGGAAAAGELLAFQASTVDGSTIDLSEYAGADLVIWFWAPW